MTPVDCSARQTRWKMPRNVKEMNVIQKLNGFICCEHLKPPWPRSSGKKSKLTNIITNHSFHCDYQLRLITVLNHHSKSHPFQY